MGTQERWEADSGGGVSHIIKRPRLTKILDESEARIILLCAPAGYGKTTLAREWVATRPEPVLWYSGGPAMADVAALAVDLAELFGGPESELVEKVRFLAARGEAPRDLARALSKAAPPQKTILTIDDLHWAEPDGPSAQLVRELFGLTQLRFLVTSRIRPNWIDARKVAYGEAESIGPERLSFTDDEVGALIPGGFQFVDRAHGWPAVIGLAAFSQRTGVQPTELSPTQLYEFFAHDLFAAAAPDLRSSLMLLAAGADASSGVRRELLGSDDLRIMEAAAAHGFIIGQTPDSRSIHPLLRQFLLQQLQAESPKTREAIVSRVTAVLTDHECWDTCLELLEVFPVDDLAARAIELALPELLSAGRTKTVERWVALSTRERFTHPVFSLAEAELALRQGKYVDAHALAEFAAQQLQGDAAARAYLASSRAAHQLDNIEKTVEHTEAAVKLAVSPDLKTEALWTALASAFERDPARLPLCYERLRNLDTPSPVHAYRVACAEAFVLLTDEGNIHDALLAAERAVVLSQRVRDPLPRSNALNLRAHLFRVAGFYDKALELAEALITEARESGIEFVIGHALLAQASASVGLRSLRQASTALRAVESYSSTSAHVFHNASMVQARARIAAGDLGGAANALSGPIPTSPLALRGEVLTLKALIAASQGHGEEAYSLLAEADPTSRYEEVSAYVSLTRAVLGLSRPNARGAANTAISRCLTRGNADSVVTACRASPLLLEVALSEGGGQEFRSQLEAVFGRSNDRDLGRRAGLAMPRELQRRAQLSPRELEVYELLALGRTNVEIARTLFISKATVKAHVQHLLEKLGVHTRVQAAALFRTDDD